MRRRDVRDAAGAALLLCAVCAWSTACAGTSPSHVPGADFVDVPGTPAVRADGPRLLLVTAHPDDDIGFAGLVYKATHLLGARADLCVLTDGQGGFKYATLAEAEYGLELTDERVGRAYLPAIRREELRRSCAHYGVGRILFLDQPDERYTLDLDEILGPEARVWDLARVRRALAALVGGGQYDFVLVMTPTPDTHAHHQAASILACEAVAVLPADDRPVVLRVRTARAGEEPAPFDHPAAYPATAPRADAAPFVFDRAEKFGYRDALDYRIVVNWAIAEHRSQGTMQLLTNAAEVERYELLAVGPPDSLARTERLFERLRAPQFAPKSYGQSAGVGARP